MERRNFRKRTQQPGESFDDFLVALRELAKTCKFCTEDCTQKNIRDQVIEGILNGDTTEELLKVRDLTLDDAIAKCRASEAAKKQRAEMSHVGPVPEPAIQALRGMQARSSPPSSKFDSASPVPHPSNATCPGCGARSHQGGQKQCPAYVVTCHTCRILPEYVGDVVHPRLVLLEHHRL